MADNGTSFKKDHLDLFLQVTPQGLPTGKFFCWLLLTQRSFTGWRTSQDTPSTKSCIRMFMTPARASNLEGPPSPAVEPCLLLGSLSRKRLLCFIFPLRARISCTVSVFLNASRLGRSLSWGGPFQVGWNQLFPVILSSRVIPHPGGWC